jgi:hypothetical protein
MQLGLHVAEELSPTVWQVTATSWQVAFQLTGVITPAKWMAIDLGGGIGVLALSTPDTVIRQLPDGRVETILGQTQVTPVFGPLARIAFYPGSSGFGFGGQAALDITMTRLATTLGTQEGGTNAEQHIKAFPTFGVFAGWRF